MSTLPTATPQEAGFDPAALAPAFAKMARIEAGEPGVKLRFVHYGDSHIASDLMTGAPSPVDEHQLDDLSLKVELNLLLILIFQFFFRIRRFTLF